MGGAGGSTSTGACSLGTNAPFFIGAMVGADPFRWGDLRPSPGLAELPDIAADLAGRGFNAIWLTGFDGSNADLPLLPIWMSAADRHCLRVVIEGNGGRFAIQKASNAEAAATLAHARAEVIPTWQGIARDWGRHPNLLAYCPVEEIGDNVELGETPTLSALAEVGRAIAEIDPVHPVTTIHISTWPAVVAEEARMRGPNLKVLVADIYPFIEVNDWSDPDFAWRTPDQQTRGYLDWIGRLTETARGAGVPSWVFAQAFSGTWYRRTDGNVESRPLFVMPDLSRLRFQVWAAVLLGSRGVFLFVYHSSSPYPDDVLAALPEWEYDTGLRTVDGQATPALEAAAVVARELAPLLPTLGRLTADGPIVEEGMILARPVSDPTTGRRYVVLVNRDLASPKAVPTSFVERFRLASPEPLAAGDGRLLPL
jgi:hypothetical protein